MTIKVKGFDGKQFEDGNERVELLEVNDLDPKTYYLGGWTDECLKSLVEITIGDTKLLIYKSDLKKILKAFGEE